LIGGTAYAGEMKKAIFTLLNYVFPSKDVLPMHCSATAGAAGDVSLFFGLSGTGKTTLSSDPDRYLIGDDEHGWSESGIFNFEGGCYAKTIRLSKEYEPVIWNAVERPGSILENVIMDQKTGQINYDDNRLTENTRAAYPLKYLPNIFPTEIADHPNHLFFLSADAFGVLPAIAKLDTQQTMEFFLAGYTSKLAGTEKGLNISPTPTFSACFAAPFLPRPPQVYARQLAQRIEQHHTAVWLVNTGWFGGPYGIGKRYPLPVTRRLIHAAILGELDHVPMELDPIFGLTIPSSCPGVTSEFLHPWKSWQNQGQYRETARKLLAAFQDNEKHLSLIQN
jgi:phosphoenolpyruvate carboxykinase (ATP)